MVNQQTAPAVKKSLSRSRKIAVGVGTLIAAGAVVAGIVFEAKSSTAHDASAAAATPVAGLAGSPAAKASATAHRTPAAMYGPAQKLASLDGEGRPVDQYQQILGALAPRCKEAPPRLVAVVKATLADLQRNGVNDEDEFSVLQHLEQSVPAGNPRVNCASSAAAYARVREEG